MEHGSKCGERGNREHDVNRENKQKIAALHEAALNRLLLSPHLAALKTTSLRVLRRLSFPQTAVHLKALIWIQRSTLAALMRGRRMMKGTEEQRINKAVTGKRNNQA